MAKTTALSMDRYQDCYLAVHIARILKHNGYETLNLCPQKDLVQQVTAKGIVDPVVISALTRENIDTAAVSKKLVDRSPNKASLTP